MLRNQLLDKYEDYDKNVTMKSCNKKKIYSLVENKKMNYTE